jgi:hypothetical protein
MKYGSGPPTATFYRCLEEAQGIARSTLFGPVVRKEAVQGDLHPRTFFIVGSSQSCSRSAMLILAAWSTSGWLPSGHAMRMALDLGLHRALEKLADTNGKKRSEEEERDLGIHFRHL